MRRFLLVICALLVLASPCRAAAGRSSHVRGHHTQVVHASSGAGQKKVYVKGYVRKDGTYVPGHYRAAGGARAAATPSGTARGGGKNGGCATCPRDAGGRIQRSPAARATFLRMTGYPHGRPGYVVDHIIPLECGGADAPSNMQWQTVAEAKAKDRTERLCRR